MSEGLKNLFAVLSRRVGFQAVNQDVTANRVRVMGRVHPDGMEQWLAIMLQLGLAGARASWNIDLSKHYFPRNGKLVFGWRVIIQAPNVEQHLASVTSVVQGAPAARRRVNEQRLVGTSSVRSGPRVRGKGASETKDPMLMR